MFDLLEPIFNLVLEFLFEMFAPQLLWAVSWPVALAISTPPILLVALVAVLFNEGKFFREIRRGYGGVCDFMSSHYPS